jgi:hypothetical protein
MNQLSEEAPKPANKVNLEYTSGQTLVIFALMLVALIALVGIAVDVGFGFVRASQFSAAVDAAALAGVVDLDPLSESDTSKADIRAWQFLGANGWPTRTITSFASDRSFTQLGIPDYTITVTWPVESFFMRIFGIEGFPVTRSATAAYFAQAEMFTATAFDRSHARKASQFIFGPQACTREGDPVSPRLSTPGQPNEAYHLANGVYRYAFRVPANYAAEKVRVELFDPDSENFNLGNSATFIHSDTYANTTNITSTIATCDGGNGELCVLPTGESLVSVFQNPFWFVRVDEAYDGGCNALKNNPLGNTETTFELYHYDNQGRRVQLARYVETNSYVSQTDLRWVTPGVPSGPLNFVLPADGSFEVTVAAIPPGLGGARYIYLDVRAEVGNSKNVFDVRAGLPAEMIGQDWFVFNNINEHNLFLANNAAFDPSGGVETFALGRMPIQTYFDNARLKIPLAPVASALAESAVYVTIFDYDIFPHGTAPPPEIEFTIDTVPQSEFLVLGKITTADPGSGNVASLCGGNDGLDCNNTWIWPQFGMGLPSTLLQSGTLFGEYIPRRNAHTWSISITSGRPVLTR